MATGEIDYDKLAERLTDPDVPLGSGAELRGADAAAAGREFLLREYGSMTAVEAAMRPGRPKLGTKRGPSPTVRGRVPEVDRAAFDVLIEQSGKNESELVREAVHLLLERHGLVAS